MHPLFYTAVVICTQPDSSEQAMERCMAKFFDTRVKQEFDYIDAAIASGFGKLSTELSQIMAKNQSALVTLLDSYSRKVDGLLKPAEMTTPNNLPQNNTSPLIKVESAHPYPGNVNDYNVIIPIVLKSLRCGSCCTCAQGSMCLFSLYSQLLTILGKYPQWMPPNPFMPTAPNQANSFLLEMALKSTSDIRCRSCATCAAIDRDPRLSFMLSPRLANIFGFRNLNESSVQNLLMGSPSLGGDANIALILSMLNELNHRSASQAPNGCPSQVANPSLPNGQPFSQPRNPLLQPCNQPPQCEAPKSDPINYGIQRPEKKTAPPTQNAYGRGYGRSYD
ncbi:hypothetical protein TCON_2483 [Astathelohania contejeani]|uniref:Uncharacterized protein n=1 Tax=Astathelohania contejeani TaxID=164912 RepID=A0ABQ7HVW9_9MICR|nr:hypothetical protein TCON_2483 [Thelohania contejeani]